MAELSNREILELYDRLRQGGFTIEEKEREILQTLQIPVSKYTALREGFQKKCQSMVFDQTPPDPPPAMARFGPLYVIFLCFFCSYALQM